MNIQATVTVPKLIYDIYATAAAEMEGYSVEDVMSAALHTYAQYLYEDMKASGQLS